MCLWDKSAKVCVFKSAKLCEKYYLNVLADSRRKRSADYRGIELMVDVYTLNNQLHLRSSAFLHQRKSARNII